MHRRFLPLVALLAMALLALPAVPVAAQPPTAPTTDTISIIKEAEVPTPAEITVRLSQATDLPDPSRVIISRDDEFADALASGLMQGSSPLMLVPRTGAIPTVVLDEIRRLGAQRAVILGGDAAVAQDVESQLQAEGLETDRRFGNSRFETAVDIARREAPDATTMILARAGSDDPNNPTAGFADALGSGALAAENGWPILLTSTNELTPVTRDYINTSNIQEIKIVGGTAAVSQAVEDEVRGMVPAVQRIGAGSRFGTAVEIAKEAGAEDAGDVGRVVLVDGTSPEGFVGGFAAAAHAAANDAPILLVDGIQVPQETRQFLAAGEAFAQSGHPRQVTCVVHPLACDGSREELGLVDYPLLEVSPPINSLVQPGQQVSVHLAPEDGGGNALITVKGSCLDGQQDLTTDSSGVASFFLTDFPSDSFCSLEVTYGTEPDLLRQGYGYVFDGEPRGEEIGVSTGVFTYGTEVASTPAYVDSTIACDGPAGPIQDSDAAYEANYVHTDGYVQSFALTSLPVDSLPGDTCTVTAQVPDGVARVLWGVYNWSDAGLRNPLLLGQGTTASFTFADLGTEVTDVDVVWILELHSPDIGTPSGLDGGATGSVFNPDGLGVFCDDGEAPEGFSTHAPGVTCQVDPPMAGAANLVVEPGRPLVAEGGTAFTTQPVSQTVAVYNIFTDAGGAAPEVSCETAPELPFAEITPGFTTPSSPVAVHTFYAFAGEQLRFRADDPFGGEFDPTLTLLGPSGAQLPGDAGFNDDGDSGLNSRIDVQIEEEGEYCLIVEGFGGSTGDFLLAADFSPAITETGTLSPSQPVASFPFQATAGEYVVLELRALGFSPTDPVLELYDPSGNAIAFDDDGGGFPNSRIVLQLPSTGQYEAVGSVFGDSYGDYGFEASFFTLSGARRR